MARVEEEELVLRRSRLKYGFSQIVLVLFALLCIFAPVLNAGVTLGDVDDHLRAPAAPRADMADMSVAVTDAEEEPDEPEAGFADAPKVASVSPQTDKHQLVELFQIGSRRLPGPFGTGPPTL